MNRLFVSVVLLVAALQCSAAEFYMSMDGDDANDGSEAKPFRTMQRAAESMQDGDVCYLRGGRYTEPQKLENLHFSDLRFQTRGRITFAAYENEKVILDGTEDFSKGWKKWKGNIYSRKMEKPIWQLFIGDKLVQVARWPNASLADGSIWRMEASMRSTDRKWEPKKKAFSGKTQDGIIYDRNWQTKETADTDEGATDRNALKGINRQTLAETGIDFTGALAVLNIKHWLTFTRPVTGHKAGQDWFTYETEGTAMAKYPAYYLLGFQCLDKENEWWYDQETKTAYLYAPGGADPNSLPVRGKVRDYSFEADNAWGVTLRGVQFFGATFRMVDCGFSHIEDCQLLYPATHKFMLGGLEWFVEQLDDSPLANVTTMLYNHGIKSYENVIRNCRMEYVNAPAMMIFSPQSLVENCYIHDVEWDVNSSGASGSLMTGERVTLRRNTLHTTGASEGIRCGAASVVELNNVYHLGYLQHDGSAINMGTDSQVGSIIRRNWVHDTNRQGIRLDSTKVRHGRSGRINHNVIYHINAGGMGSNQIKGNEHRVFNNTIMDAYMAVPHSFGEMTDMNTHTIIRNNLCEDIVESNIRNRRDGSPALFDCNLTGAGVVEQTVRDSANLDFRPKAGSAAIDAGKPLEGYDIDWSGKGPDIGAYEYGDDHYWIPGYKKETASMPVPPDGAKNVKADADLMFLEALNAGKHTVHFGMTADCKDDFQTLEKTNIYTPQRLEPGKTYYWRVDTESGKGNVWSFTVGQ